MAAGIVLDGARWCWMVLFARDKAREHSTVVAPRGKRYPITLAAPSPALTPRVLTPLRPP